MNSIKLNFDEIHILFIKLYDLDGREYYEDDAIAIYIEAMKELSNENPLFIGSKFIYSGGKFGSNKTTARYFETIRHLHAKFPEFLAGFDLSGQEDKALPLITFVEQILQLPKDIKLFFHAGETNWFGSTDENLVISANIFSFIYFLYSSIVL